MNKLDELKIAFKIQNLSSRVTVIKFSMAQDYRFMANQSSPEVGGKVRGSNIIVTLVE